MRGKARETSREAARVALAFAYDGALFDSFARQPGRRTVEGELLRALASAGAIEAARAARYEVASRTDAGVSAAWNVCAFDTRRDPRSLAALGHDADGLWLLSAVGVPDGFSPRRAATSKTYVYHVHDEASYDWDAIAAAARLFEGQHDFRNYCRPDRDVPTRRTLTRVGVEPGRLVFEAPNFLWEQVRRITQALLDVGRGAQTSDGIEKRLRSTRRDDPQPPAPPDGLVLLDVRVPVEFPPLSKSARSLLLDRRRAAWLRWRFYEGLSSRAPTARR